MIWRNFSMIEIRFHGRGGQGAVTAAEILAKAVFEEDYSFGESIVAGNEFLQGIYNDETGYKLAIFHLEEATAEIRDITGKINESYNF